MALTATTLGAACPASASAISVASASGFGVGNLILVEQELMAQSGPAAGLVVPVRRGLDGTVQGAHAAAAFVATGLGTDFPTPAPGQVVIYGPETPDGMQQGWGYNTYSVAGAIPVVSGVHIINGSAITAMTIAAPTVAQEGAELTVISKNLHANTLVATPAYLGAAGGTATFAATGGSVKLKVVGGKLAVIASAGVAFT